MNESNIEALLIQLVEQNATVIELLTRVERQLEDISGSVSVCPDVAGEIQAAAGSLSEIKDELNWMERSSTAGTIIEHLGRIEENTMR